MSEQQPVQILDSEQMTDKQKRLSTLFADIESKQLEFLDQAAKSIIERTATFLTVLFGITAFGANFPPAYLKGTILAKVLVIVTLVFYLLAIGAGMWTIQPRHYNLYDNNLTEMRRVLNKIISRKSLWLRVAGILFGLGSVTLAALIVAIILRA